MSIVKKQQAVKLCSLPEKKLLWVRDSSSGLECLLLHLCVHITLVSSWGLMERCINNASTCLLTPSYILYFVSSGKELIPTKMSPNTVFDKATDIIRQNREVQQRFGEAFKTYGRDHGGHREGRRNFIEHTEYVNQDDGTKRTRVRFNLEGPYGQAFVFAEVSKDMPSGEYVYILVQDKRNGAVITVQDNRSSLLAKKLAGGDKDGQDVFSQLLSGGKK